MRRPTTAYAALGVAALLFGATFVVVKEAIETLAPMPFIGWRFLIGALALLLLAVPRGSAVWRDGAVAGFFLFAGYAFQTWGLVSTTAGNSGLITGLFVVLTPILAAAATRRLPRGWTVTGAFLAFAGLALLVIDESFQVSSGDSLTVVCAVAFSLHIITLSRVAYRHPVIPFTAVQLLVTGVLALLVAAVVGDLTPPTASDMPPLLLTGLGVSAGAFLLQVWAQTVVGPARTALVLTLEPVFATAFGMWLLHERLTPRDWVGAVLILTAIYLVVATAREGDSVPTAEAVSPAH